MDFMRPGRFAVGRAGVEHPLEVGLLHHLHPALLRTGPDAAAGPRLPGGQLEEAAGGALQPPGRRLGTLLLVSSPVNVDRVPWRRVHLGERVALQVPPGVGPLAADPAPEGGGRAGAPQGGQGQREEAGRGRRG